MATDFKKQGKANRASGKRFEVRVRKFLEDKYIVVKWQNNVSEVFQSDIGEYDRKLEACKPRFNPFTKGLMMNSGGFPDFLCYKAFEYNVIGVECKLGKYTSQTEKDKMEWLLKRGIFQKIYIAYKHKRSIQFQNFESGEDEIIC